MSGRTGGICIEAEIPDVDRAEQIVMFIDSSDKYDIQIKYNNTI